MSDDAPRTRILIVEDDLNIVDLIRSNLAVRGYDVTVAGDGQRALALLETARPEIILLDLMLPDIDGFDLCRQVRERSNVGVIVVSARGGDRDKVAALNLGADDYMTKPFSIEELLARIAATLRRTRPAADAAGAPTRIALAGDLELDLAAQQVLRGGEPLHLTPTEFALLRELAGERGKVLTHAQLLRRVWGRGYETETEYVRVYVRRLRAKLESEGGRAPDHHAAAGRLPPGGRVAPSRGAGCGFAADGDAAFPTQNRGWTAVNGLFLPLLGCSCHVHEKRSTFVGGYDGLAFAPGRGGVARGERTSTGGENVAIEENRARDDHGRRRGRRGVCE